MPSEEFTTRNDINSNSDWSDEECRAAGIMASLIEFVKYSMVGDDAPRLTYRRDATMRPLCLTTSRWCNSEGGALYSRQHLKVEWVLLFL